MDTFVFHLMPYRAVEGEAWPFAEDSWDPERGARYYAEYLEQLEYAADLGFDGLGFNEHHFSAYGLQPAPIVTASYMAAKTDDVALGFFGNVLPVRRNPVRVAEEIAMIDNVSEGRVICGFPRGLAVEYLAYNVPHDESRDRLAEAWDLVVRTWTAEEPFDHHGEFFDFENVYAWPRPYQQPHPPLWMPATSEQSLRFAAEREAMIATAGPDAAAVGENFDAYTEIAESEFGWSPGPEDFSVTQPVYVAETDEQAREEAREHLQFFYQTLFTGVHLGEVARLMGDDRYDPDRREEYVENFPPRAEMANNWSLENAIESGRALVGSPETVVAQLERQQEATGGYGTLIGHFQFGTLPHELAKENLRRYAEEVMPEVRSF